MLFLLPPSETKQTGGSSLTVSEVALIFGKLTDARDLVLDALIGVCGIQADAVRALKLGPRQLEEITTNLAIKTAPTMPAIERYTGTLYEALKLGGLSPEEIKRAKENVLIQSALFGLISATDRIPAYRLSASSKIPNLNLRKIWTDAHLIVWARLESGMLIDMRSKQYAALAPIPDDREHFEMEVLHEEKDGTRKLLNHFNKESKGKFLRAVLQENNHPSTISELKSIANASGFKLEQNGKKLLLVNLH
jgi:cytoplasmic iron level regulating protein YaaA (DUF328/UPF0246 family)